MEKKTKKTKNLHASEALKCKHLTPQSSSFETSRNLDNLNSRNFITVANFSCFLFCCCSANHLFTLRFIILYRFSFIYLLYYILQNFFLLGHFYIFELIILYLFFSASLLYLCYFIIDMFNGLACVTQEFPDIWDT